MARRHHHRAQVITAFVRRLQDLEDGKVRCAGCSAIVSLTRSGKIRKHKSPAGEDCAYTASYAAPVRLDALPPVVLPEPRSPKARRPTRASRARKVPERADEDARRARRTGECTDCGRWLPGERILCNRCQRKRNAAKGRST